MNSPAVDSWYGKNGTISIDENGVWTYHDWEGNAVSYPNGYQNFKSAGIVRQEAPIGPFVERSKDFVKAREMGYIKSADGTIVDEIACYEETVKMKLPKDYKEFCNYSEPALRKDEIRMT